MLSELRGMRRNAPLFCGSRIWGPCIAPSSSLDLGDVGEDCLSTWAPLGASCEFHSRRGQAGSTGYAHSARHRGGLLFGDFSLGRTRESHRRPDV